MFLLGLSWCGRGDKNIGWTYVVLRKGDWVSVEIVSLCESVEEDLSPLRRVLHMVEASRRASV
jgi:hypothetical protein